jgi:hypothetical protein
MEQAVKAKVEENPVMQRVLPEPELRAWAGARICAILIQSIITWLDAGRPNQEGMKGNPKGKCATPPQMLRYAPA